MPDQVPVVPADGAVEAAVDRPVVAPPAPAIAAGDNNAQKANGNVVPAPQPAAPEISVARFPHRSLLHHAYTPLFQENNCDNNRRPLGLWRFVLSFRGFFSSSIWT